MSIASESVYVNTGIMSGSIAIHGYVGSQLSARYIIQNADTGKDSNTTGMLCGTGRLQVNTSLPWQLNSYSWLGTTSNRH